MYKPQKVERLEEVSPEQYESIVVSALEMTRKGHAGVLTKALALSLHKEKEEWRKARLNDRVSDYDGLTDFLDTLNNFNAGIVRERDLDFEAQDKELGKAMRDTRTFLASKMSYPPEDNLYQWLVLAFAGYDGTGRVICNALREAKPVELRKRLLEHFQREAKYEIL